MCGYAKELGFALGNFMEEISVEFLVFRNGIKCLKQECGYNYFLDLMLIR